MICPLLTIIYAAKDMVRVCLPWTGKGLVLQLTLEPRAGPTGGAGLALPALSASLMYPVTVHQIYSEMPSLIAAMLFTLFGRIWCAKGLLHSEAIVRKGTFSCHRCHLSG